MANPLDDYLMAKKADQGILPGMGRFMGGMGSRTLGNLRTGAEEAIGSGAVGLAATGLGVAALKVYRAIGKRKDFKSMMEHNPDLQEMQSRDPSKFNAHYNSLRTLVPSYAQDPIISGSLMRSMSFNPEHAGSILTQSMETRSKHAPSLSMDMGPAKFQTKL